MFTSIQYNDRSYMRHQLEAVRSEQMICFRDGCWAADWTMLTRWAGLKEGEVGTNLILTDRVLTVTKEWTT